MGGTSSSILGIPRRQRWGWSWDPHLTRISEEAPGPLMNREDQPECTADVIKQCPGFMTWFYKVFMSADFMSYSCSRGFHGLAHQISSCLKMRLKKVTFFIDWVINKIFYCICSMLQLRDSCAYRKRELGIWISSSLKRAWFGVCHGDFGLGNAMGILAWGKAFIFVVL